MKQLLALFITAICVQVAIGSDVHDYVAKPSVTVMNENSQVLGSGTIFISKGKAYVLTCGHLFPSMRTEEELSETDKDGTTKKVKKVVWKAPKISSLKFNDKGKEVGERVANCRILFYSPSEEEGGIDLALLEVLESDFSGATFLKDELLVRPGLEVLHIGALYGIKGCLTKGIISRVDYQWKSRPFNVGIINGRPGSSGGGVFAFENGRYVYVGMVVRGDEGGLMMLKTPDTIRTWLKSHSMDHVISGK